MNPARLVFRDSLLRSLQDLRTRHAVSLLISQAGLGKSCLLETLIHELRQQDQKLVHVIVRKGEDLEALLPRILGHLELTPQPGSEMDQLSQALEQKQLTLILDQFERLQKAEIWLESLAQNLTQAKLIIASRRMPKLRSSLLAEIGILRIEKFSETELELLIQKLWPELLADQNISRELIARAKGNPEMLKRVLGLLKLSHRAPGEADLRELFKAANSEQIEELSQSWSEADRLTLQVLSFVRFDPLLIDSLVESSPQLEFVHGYELESIQNQISIETQNQEEVFRILLSHLSRSSRASSRAEEVRIFIAQGQTEKAKKILEDHDQELFSKLKLNEYLLLTDPLKDHLSPRLIYRRSLVHRYTGDFDQALQEPLAALPRFSHQADRHWIEYSIYRSRELSDSNYRPTQDYLDLLSRGGLDPEIFVRTNMRLFSSRVEEVGLSNDHQRGEALRGEIISFVKQNPQVSTDILFEFCFMILYLNEGTGRMDLIAQDLAFFRQKEMLAISGSTARRMLGIEIDHQLDMQGTREVFDRSWKLIEQCRSWQDEWNFAFGLSVVGDHEVARGRALSLSNRFEREGILRPSLIFDLPIVPIRYSICLLNSGRGAEAIRMGRQLSSLMNPRSIYSAIIKDFQDCLQLLESKPDQLWTFCQKIEGGHSRYYLQRFVLEAAWNSYFSFLSSSFSLNDVSTFFKVPILKDEIRVQVIGGWAYWRQSKDALAEQALQKALEMVEPTAYYLLRYRALCGLAVLEIKQGRLTSALSKLRLAEALHQEMDPLSELSLAPLLITACLWRMGEKEQARDYLKKVPGESFFDYLRYLLNQELKVKSVEPMPTVSEAQQSFCKKMADDLGLRSAQRLECRDESGRIFETSAQSSWFKSKEWVWDRLKGVIQSGGKDSIAMRDKAQIQELLYFFLCHPKQVFSKEQMIGYVWKESYNPLVHDSRIYTSVKRIRQLLTLVSKKEAIVQEGGKYGLHPEMKFACLSLVRESLGLNERQEWMLDFADQNGSLDRQTAEKVLGVSSAQVKRDLKELVERGLLEQTGAARATKYVRGTGSKNSQSIASARRHLSSG